MRTRGSYLDLNIFDWIVNLVFHRIDKILYFSIVLNIYNILDTPFLIPVLRSLVSIFYQCYPVAIYSSPQ